MAVTAPSFTGFRPEAIQFLADLAANNERAWFQPRKAEYERLLKEPMEELCVALEAEFRAGTSRSTRTPARSPFRIYRDTRFSKDKSPYKTHVAASFAWAGDGDRAATGRSHTESVHASGGYFHLQPGEIYVGGGVWHPDKSWLTAFRAARRGRSTTASGRSSRRRRSGRRSARSATTASRSSASRPASRPDHPAADLLRLKNVTFGRRLSDAEAMSPDLPVVIAEFVRGRDPADAVPRLHLADPRHVRSLWPRGT